MKVVIDTSVIVSAFFFGGGARQIVEAVVRGRLTAYATREIVAEYEAALAEMEARGKRGLRRNLALPFTTRLHIVAPKANGGKFISCALATKAVYVVGDGEDVTIAGEGRSVAVATIEGVCRLLALCAI